MIYLVHTAADPDEVMAAGLADEVIELTARFLAVDTRLSRSQLYHQVKALSPRDAPLLVAELDEPPKIKGMAPGSTAWLRSRLRPGIPDRPCRQ